MNDSTATAPPQSPNCKGCGTAVEKGVEFCAVCQDREESRPRPMFNTAKQPAPPEPQGDVLGGFASR